MNSEEKEDCECAPPQAETSPAGGPNRWGHTQETVGVSGDASRHATIES